LQWRKKTCFSCPSLDFETMRGKSENLLSVWVRRERNLVVIERERGGDVNVFIW
jgi:hypothetical protein